MEKGKTPQAVAGVAGTRHCDWWFTDDAVLVDTAGRYTTQDSDAKADSASWIAFLALLRKYRPSQPRNGVIVAISITDLVALSAAQLAAHQEAIRKRLAELHEQLGIEFPVDVVLTKADLIAGFTEFFGNLSEAQRHTVWGHTFPTADRKQSMIGEVPGEYDRLLERLSAHLPDRLQAEPNLKARVSLIGFPNQMAAMRLPVLRFLTGIFDSRNRSARRFAQGLLFHIGHSGRHADRSAARLNDQDLQRTGRPGPRLLRIRQELFPSRPPGNGDHRRGRLGLDQSSRRT